MSFENKVVLVTGGSAGIGAATAELLSSRGATLVLTGRNAANLGTVAKKCEAVHPQKLVPLTIVADVTDQNESQQLIERIATEYQRLDVLINSAGIIESGTIETSTLAQYDRIMDVNVRAIFALTQLAVPLLIKSKGNVVNLSSVCGLRAFPNVLAYNMSKSAVDQFTNCVALELAPKGVRVNSVCPGVIVTELHKRGGMDEETYAKFLENCKNTHALGRPGDVREVAAAIAFLASDEASFITGVQLPVDGGRHAMCPR